jgi:ParB family transcriptional regulator, chromosome partitioning protein
MAVSNCRIVASRSLLKVSGPRRTLEADRLAAAVNLDMADWWTATGESYLGRVKKDQAITAISEATGDNDLEDLRKLKKAELVATAERRLAEKRWLPEILRR